MMPSVNLGRDDAALLANAERWTAAMERMGKPAVQAEMARRPPHPGDRIYDIVHEPPHPSREFCQQWCTEQDNVVFRFSKSTGIIIVLIVVITGSLVQVFHHHAGPPHGAASSAAAMRASMATPQMAASQMQGVPTAPRYQSLMSTSSSGATTSSSLANSLLRPLNPPLAPSFSGSAATPSTSPSTPSAVAPQQ